MALLRIEPRLDPASGNYFLEVFWPHDADTAFVTTQPRYKTEAAAETDLIAIIAAAASTPRRPDDTAESRRPGPPGSA